MRSATLKWIILVSTITIGLLVAAQLFWLNKVYNYEQKEFHSGVIKSIQGVYEDLELEDSVTTHLQKLIEQPNPNSFLFRISYIPDKDTLFDDMLDNLEAFEVFSDCEIAVYDGTSKDYLYRSYLPAPGTRHAEKNQFNLPVYQKGYSYALLYFPYRNQYILAELRWWILAGVVLLLLLTGLALSVFYLYRQKFLNEVQNDFIRNVTHEFQTPLTTLTVGLDAITKSSVTDHPEKLNKYARLMQGQTQYLKQHIDNLIKVLKAESGNTSIHKEMIAPNHLVEEVLMQLYMTIEEKQAVIKTELEDADRTLLGDKSSLYLALLNIVSNAIKYAEHPVVTISTKVVHDKYRISVRDNGIGIDEVYQKKIFKKFFRVPTGDIHTTKGLGLGLYFTKKAIRQHRGKIMLNSGRGNGTEFIIELPLLKQ